jgi:hypothetical protein
MSSSAGTREGAEAVDGGDWVALGAVVASALVSLVAIFQGPVISATQQRQAEHEKHVRDRRADAYIAQLVSVLRQMAYMNRVHPPGHPLGPPETDDPSPPSDEERWLTTARVMAYGSERMKGLVQEWDGLVLMFKGLAIVLSSPIPAPWKDEESHDSESDSREQEDWYKKMVEIRTDAEKLFEDIEKTVADELQISLPVVPQDPSDRFNAWLDRNSRPPQT